ncbi:hypothetical protein KNP414_01328 [Paenibacillus mucilaginosus KNP414]|uniref:Uncharacterized protein n=1 Tax=Paenibacillus mucilaginosus (strain KNP414) TaxID=1036673 RepID=F8FJC9_PAEMK|nr:hypothetical protein KNP414_01328 [Paenibacillus mucilaginosus KNP414]
MNKDNAPELLYFIITWPTAAKGSLNPPVEHDLPEAFRSTAPPLCT